MDQLPQRSLDLQGIHILVVDDDFDTRDFLEFFLQASGAVVTTVASAEEALTVLSQVQPDVLLSDIGLPGMDGYTLMRRVRGLPPEQGGKIPAIAFTAWTREADQLKALEAGFQMHISKPVNLEKLSEAIASFVKLR